MLVIILLMTILTLTGGDKPRRVQDSATGEWTTTRVNKFLDAENLVLLVKDASFIAIMAVGMTAVIVMGGIDLSVGSIYALAALLGAMALRALQSHWGTPGPDGAATAVPMIISVVVGIGICAVVGGACGAANGAMVVGLRVHPFIITLGMMVVLRGVVFVLTQGQSVLGLPESFTSGFFKAEVKIGDSTIYPVPVIIMLIVASAGMVMLSRTVIGRRVYAIGGNEIAARYAGIPVGRVKILVYTLCGMLGGVSSCVYIGYLGGASPDAGQGYELSVIAASVIGGASLSGGRGSAVGAVLGAVLIQLITNAMIILEIDPNYTNIVMGAAIVIAVVLDQIKSRLMAR